MGKINNLEGQKFGRLRVLSFEGLNNHRKATWLCQCDCGKTSIAVGSSLLNGSHVSCGCYQSDEAKKRFTKDMIGKKFGRLTVLTREGTHVSGRSKLALWGCICDCGNETVVRGASLRNGTTKSCGCAQRENASIANTTHGLSRTRIHRVWQAMKKRCENPNDKNYFNYGGRGIHVCEEWKDDFMSFYRWANSNDFDEGLTIDRIDVNGNYEPSNCMWVTQKVQSNNTRRNKFFYFKGEERTLSQISDICGIRYGVLYKRLNRGWSLEEAVSSPLRDNGYYGKDSN